MSVVVQKFALLTCLLQSFVVIESWKSSASPDAQTLEGLLSIEAKAVLKSLNALSGFLLAFKCGSAFNVVSGQLGCRNDANLPALNQQNQHRLMTSECHQPLLPLRRKAISGVLAALLVPSRSWVDAATITGDTSRMCKTSSTPSATIVTCRGFGLEKGSLHGCGADEACIGTSATSPTKYSYPWGPPQFTSEAKDIKRAWRSLVEAVEDQLDLRIAERLDDQFYLRAEGKAAIPPEGTDDVEFLLTNELPPQVLYRSASRQAIFLYPLQQPVANQESHVQRLEAIRTRLGWNEIGRFEYDIDDDKQGARGFFSLPFQGAKVPDFDAD